MSWEKWKFNLVIESILRYAILAFVQLHVGNCESKIDTRISGVTNLYKCSFDRTCAFGPVIFVANVRDCCVLLCAQARIHEIVRGRYTREEILGIWRSCWCLEGVC